MQQLPLSLKKYLTNEISLLMLFFNVKKTFLSDFTQIGNNGGNAGHNIPDTIIYKYCSKSLFLVLSIIILLDTKQQVTQFMR